MEFTDEEKKAILAGITLETSLYTADALLDTIAASFDIDDVTGAILGNLQGVTSPEVLTAARANATRQARQITGNIARSELQKVAKKVEENLAAGLNPRDLINSLTEIKDLDSNRAATFQKYKDTLIEQGIDGADLKAKTDRMHEKLLRDRRETIARTEQRMATENGMLDRAKADGNKYKMSISAQDDRVSDICEANQAQGWIPIDQAFSSGDDAPTYHPNCRCTIAYMTDKPDAIDQELPQELAERTAEAKA